MQRSSGQRECWERVGHTAVAVALAQKRSNFNGDTGIVVETSSGGGAMSSPHDDNVIIPLNDRGFDLLNQSYEQLKDSIYTARSRQTRLKPYLDAITLEIGENGIALNYDGMMAKLETLKASDAKNALFDLVDLQKLVGPQLVGWNGAGVMAAWMGQTRTAANDERWRVAA